MVVMIFFNELLLEFGIAKTHILSDSKIHSLEEAFSCVLCIENSQSGSPVAQPNDAFISKNNNNS